MAPKIKSKTKELLRSLPSVSALLKHETVEEWLEGLPRSAVVESLKIALDAAREGIVSGELNGEIDLDGLLAFAEQDLVNRSMSSLCRVINATGIVLHTGLGRAPLCDAAIEAMAESAAGYCNLEYDLSTGARGRRNVHVVDKLISITGAEAATVVNNNAAATLLILQTFAAGRDVIVSRGELIEIGGSFRLPEIMTAGGVTLREVGSTNRTRIADFEAAIGENTAMLFRAHPSNYRIVGFTESVPIGELAKLAHRHKLLAVDDIGSGALFDLQRFGLPEEPCVADSLTAGADLVCFSGDKLLGGPQCGIIVGRAELITKIDANPLMRTYRVDKLTLSALEATLACYGDPEEAMAGIPTLRMLKATTEELAERATALCEKFVKEMPAERFLVCSDVGFAGGGSMPGREMPTVVVQWRPSAASAETMATALREADIPVVVRIRDDAICFDLRTLDDTEFEPLLESVSTVLWDQNGEVETDGISLPVVS